MYATMAKKADRCLKAEVDSLRDEFLNSTVKGTVPVPVQRPVRRDRSPRPNASVRSTYLDKRTILQHCYSGPEMVALFTIPIKAIRMDSATRA